MDFKLFLKIFLAFCIAFAILNLAIGGFALYGYYKVQKIISTTSSGLNQSVAGVRALVSNLNGLTSIASTEIGPASRNITSFLADAEANLSTSKQDLYNESNYFSSFQLPDTSAQQSEGISAAFENLANQLNATSSRLPPIINAVRLASEQVNGSISSINASVARLNQSFYLMANNVLAEVGSTGGLVSTAILGIVIYSFMQAAVFMMLGIFLLYLMQNLYGSAKPPALNQEVAKTKTPQEPDQNVKYRIKPKRKIQEAEESEKEPDAESGEKNGGLLKTIKDTFGVED
jgi:predicted PurR-regulated permease PerM